PHPVEIRVDHDALGYERRAVALVEAEIARLVADDVAVAGVVPLDLAGVSPRVRVEQQLVRIEAVALLRRVGTVDAVAVNLSWLQILDIAVEDLVGVVG